MEFHGGILGGMLDTREFERTSAADVESGCEPVLAWIKAQPGGFVTLMELLGLFNAAYIVGNARRLDLVAKELRTKWPPETPVSQVDPVGIGAQVLQFCEMCEAIGVRLSVLEGRAVIGSLDRGTVQDAALKLEHLAATFSRELSAVEFLYLPQGSADLQRLPVDVFGQAFLDRFPETGFDLGEASKCFAMGRWTAGVFHLMRVVEAVVAAWHSELVGGRIGTTRSGRLREKLWSELQSDLQRAVEALPETTEAERDAMAAQRAALVQLDNLRRAWRNPTMHPGSVYSADEASNVFRATKALCAAIAEMV